MSAKFLEGVLDSLEHGDAEAAKDIFHNHVLKKSAQILTHINEEDSEDIAFVVDVDEDVVSFTKCDSSATAQLLVEKFKDHDEEAHFEIVRDLPEDLAELGADIVPLTMEEVEEFEDAISESDEATFTIDREDWEDISKELQLSESGEDVDTLFVVTTPVASPKVFRILNTYAETEQVDECSFIAVFDDIEILTKIANRLSAIDGVDEIQFGTCEPCEVIVDLDDQLNEAIETHRVKEPSNEDGLEIGTVTKKIKANRVSPVAQRSNDWGPTPIISTEDDDFEREDAPKYESSKLGDNVEKSFKGTTKEVKKSDFNKALINKEFKGKANTTSPIKERD